MVIRIIFFVLMVLVSLFVAYRFSVRRARKTDEISLVYKTVASLCFILLGFTSFWGYGGWGSATILLGLVMGLVGDIFLDMKYVYPKSKDLYTYVGFGAFLVGHIFYLIFLFQMYSVAHLGLWISIVIGLGAGAGIYVSDAVMGLNYGRFKLVSAVYGAFLVFLTAYSAFVCFSWFTAAKFLMFLGLVFFLVSDLILSQIYFGENKNTPMNSFINHETYYFGQILIAASIFFIRLI